MMTWTKRSRGLYDNGDWTISVGSDYFCDGSHRPFRVVVFHRRNGKQPKRYGVTVPFIRFRTSFRLRRLGLLNLYRWQSNAIYRLFPR